MPRGSNRCVMRQTWDINTIRLIFREMWRDGTFDFSIFEWTLMHSICKLPSFSTFHAVDDMDCASSYDPVNNILKSLSIISSKSKMSCEVIFLKGSLRLLLILLIIKSKTTICSRKWLNRFTKYCYVTHWEDF